MDMDQAVQALKNNQVVALPTETVYGLAGSIESDEALNKIFSTKSRPFFDPLIVHVKNANQGQNWAHWDPVSEKLAQYFWPGPLTLVLKKKDNVSDLITNGGPTVALRSPNHPLFQQAIEKLGAPLAAPSANMFGKTSPTSALHVFDEFAGKIPVVDGGECQRGIESTVIEVRKDEKIIYILRPGVVTQKQLQDFLQDQDINFKVKTKVQNHSPGHLKNHYQPEVPFVLLKGEGDDSYIESLEKVDSRGWKPMELPSDASMAARVLYSKLREFSKKDQAFYFKVPHHWFKETDFQGLMDRLEKACIGELIGSQGQWRYSSKQ